MSKLGFRYGAMNSGKSTLLINTAYNYTERGLNVATVKPTVDTKGEDFIVARADLQRKVDIMLLPDANVHEEVQRYLAKTAISKLHAILIDEVQFITPEQVDQFFEIAKFDDTSVIGYGLRTDFLGNSFPGSLRMWERADTIEKLPTMCRCGSQAEFNCRQVDGEYVFQGDQVAIDGEGAVTYDSLCGKCYLTEKAKAAAV